MSVAAATTSAPAPDPQVRLRRLRWWDVEDVAAAEPEAFGADAWSREAVLAELAGPGRAYQRAEDPAGRLVGYVGTAVHGPDAELQTVAVLPGARGRGLGRRLVAHAVAAVRAAGARRLHLEVREDSGAALRLYAGLGFRAVGRRPRYYAPSRPGGQRVAAVLMTLDLTADAREEQA